VTAFPLLLHRVEEGEEGEAELIDGALTREGRADVGDTRTICKGLLLSPPPPPLQRAP